MTLCAATLLGGLVILLASPANGQPIQSDPDPVYLKTGEAAPFDGDLFPPIRSIRLTLRAERCQEKAALDLTRAARQFEIELDARDRTAKVARETDAERIRILSEALDKADPWYRSPLFVAGVSVAGTVAVVVLSTWVISETRPLFAQ